MTMINIIKNNKCIQYIKIDGHAHHDKVGQDIVCSAISTAAQLTIRILKNIKQTSISFVITEESKQNPTIIIDVKDSDEITQTILTTFLTTLYELKEQYPLSVKIYEKER